MAERRMFAKSVIDSDMFLDMSLSTQALYFHLAMRADDDGFINNPKRIQRMIGASDDEMKILIAKQYILPFESGVVVIKHWKVHNYIRSDRYNPSKNAEKQLVELNKANLYELKPNGIPNGIPNDNQNGYQMDTQVRLGKVRLGKVRLDNNILSGKPDQLSTDIYTIIDYLNEVSGKHFKAGTPKTKTLIKARLNEGFTVDDFKTVIQKKYKQWKGGEMERYIRPETLFGTKFEGYLNESEIVEMRKDRQETPTERAMRIRAEVLGSD